ncbi:MAG: galactokinase family protein [Clostridia bacterium]|nr:galactokinase family protein [Clostridia bacterium]
MTANKLYGKNFAENLKRIEKVKQAFIDSFGFNCSDVFSSSGRAEILGNHTDHNKGCVLVGAIDRDILAACSKQSGKIIIKSAGFEDVVLQAGDYQKKQGEKGNSVSLVRGILKGFADLGYTVGGFCAVTMSNIFKGAGVSSSAAFEILICTVINHYYCSGKVTPLECAKISQYAESMYFEKPCGLLDQSGIAFGGINYIDFKDTENPEIKSITPKLDGYDIVITNCGGDHSNLTAHYAAVKQEMQQICGFFGKNYLREVPFDRFLSELPSITKKFSGRAVLRAFHFYEENIRVKSAAKYITYDIKNFLNMVNLSGESSYKLLQNCYVPQDDIQRIPLAIKLSQSFLNGAGAVRVHGGGFEGTILAFVPCKISAEYSKFMESFFGGGNVIITAIRNAGGIRLEY